MGASIGSLCVVGAWSSVDVSFHKASKRVVFIRHHFWRPCIATSPSELASLHRSKDGGTGMVPRKR